MRAKLAWALMAATVAAGSGPAWAQERTNTAISDIRQESNERQTRLTVECTGPLAYTYYSPDPLTLVVDIPEMDASQVPSRINVGSREVESIRVASMARADGRSLARLEVRLASLAPYQIYSKGKELTLIFDRPAGVARSEPDPATAKEPVVYAPAKPAAPQVAAPRTATEPTAPEPAKAAKAAKAEVPSHVEPEVPANAPRATKILAVSAATEHGRLVIDVKADGRLRHQDFFLGNPSRLVVDFPEVLSAAKTRQVEVNTDGVKLARMGQFSTNPSKVARLVLDMEGKAPYRIVDRADGMQILFGEGPAPAPTALAAMRAPEPDPAAMPEPRPQLLPAPAPAPVMPMPILPEPQIAPMSSGPLGAQEIGPATGAKKYTGAPISLDFKDGDLQDIFRLFADISGLNVVVNPGVSGKVTLKLNEVPWDQALDLILKTNSLGYTLEDNVIRIARLTDLQREEQDKRKLAEEKALAGDLVPYRARLSYAKAAGLEATVKKVALSPRGNITIDERTNTMIITDLQQYLDKAVDLIRDLDRATPQVEIEARIVVTSRNFTRQIGIQWGFLNQQAPQYGNTTGLAFPNSIVLNGQGVPSTAGLRADQGNGLASGAGIGTENRGYAVNLPAGGFNTALGISMGNILGSFNLDAALTALENQGRGRILSTPKITTQNNQSAEIKQGVQIPIQTNANNTIAVTFKDATLTLKVTPQITDAGTVILNLEVQNDSPDFSRTVGTGAAAVPPINTQSAKTIVLVKDGATAVIGGIYQSTEQTARQNTPFLANIPVLGYLFRNSSVRNENTELLLFITPRIVKG